ncbi:class I SAM-dependent methyltransferase [Bacillus thuringiensis]|nr:class I SAM-dependent methyltransferase [Bacillus thuringiensis]
MKDIFTYIYKHNVWGGTESVSGTGSSVHESQQLINKLPSLLTVFEIKSILDAPCGDFNWMKHVSLPSKSKYTGMDIVSDLIKENNEIFQKENVKFVEKNIVNDLLPYADLIVCRDALVHFTFEDIFNTIQNFKRSGSVYLLTTHFPSLIKNEEIHTGDWRPLNLCLYPFYFPEPIVSIKETLNIKTMSLWEIKNLDI